jgi:hypothetical protein
MFIVIRPLRCAGIVCPGLGLPELGFRPPLKEAVRLDTTIPDGYIEIQGLL